jgi:hypothetical protein
VDPRARELFIGAPDFGAEPVTHAAIALAASRGAFQFGLLDEQGEIPFATLADVIEFARRAYTGGGGGPGGGAGPTLPRPPEPGPPPGDEPRAETQDSSGPEEPREARALHDLQHAVRRFTLETSRIARGQPGEVLDDGFVSNPRDDDSSLMFAQQVLWRALRDRYADAHADPEQRLQWFESESALIATQRAAGIGPNVLPWPESRWYSRDDGDRFERLYSVPVPMPRQHSLGFDPAQIPSLGHLLARFLAAPDFAASLSDSELRRVVLAPCLLAAASLVLRQSIFHPALPEPVLGLHLRQITADAIAWLNANLPRIALPHPVESLIQRTAGMRAGGVDFL